LHNLGLLLLVHLFPGDMDAALRQVKAPEDAELRRTEAALIGIDHAQGGAWLAQRWHLPDLVVDTISGYAQEPLSEKAPVAALVGIARKQVDRLLATRVKRVERIAVAVPDWFPLAREEWREVVTDLLEQRDKLRTQAQSLS
ncbi:MAG TPA: HDOD domain-containing protein, partial [Gammaproteobacteria bacterium]|nr:HDOD domain-containing protein [Gammaproteobacteria bacterium]